MTGNKDTISHGINSAINSLGSDNSNSDQPRLTTVQTTRLVELLNKESSLELLKIQLENLGAYNNNLFSDALELNKLVEEQKIELANEQQINNKLNHGLLLANEKCRIAQQNCENLIETVEGFQRFFDQNYFALVLCVTLNKIEEGLKSIKKHYLIMKNRYTSS